MKTGHMNCLLERILLCFSMLPDADDGFDVFFFAAECGGTELAMRERKHLQKL